MWLSLLASSISASAEYSRRICSSALGGTMRSAVDPPVAGTSILARRCPLVATIRMRSGRSSQSTPFRIGRLSSVDAAKATCPTSLCTTPAAAFQAFSNLTTGKEGNSSRGRPRSLNLERPDSIDTRASPAAVTRTGPDRKSTRLNSSHSQISYAVFCLKKKKEGLNYPAGEQMGGAVTVDCRNDYRPRESGPDDGSVSEVSSDRHGQSRQRQCIGSSVRT